MFRIMQIRREKLFLLDQAAIIPPKVSLLADIKEFEADVDVVIGTHGQVEEVNQTIQNYLALEKQLRLRIWVIESSKRSLGFLKIFSSPQVNRILILNSLHHTSRKSGRFYASNGAAVAAAIGNYLGSAPYTFFSHTDMMGYKLNPFSFLLSKIDAHTPVASFTQRHILPFTGGMLYEKEYFRNISADWPPRSHNPYLMPWLKQFQQLIEPLNWIDAGEQLIFEALSRGRRAYICHSRGSTGDFFGHPLANYGIKNEDLAEFHIGIQYASEKISRERFEEKYPELTLGDNASWRKCFDDLGDVIFIHRGRGNSKGKRNDGRGDFLNFLKKFNRKNNAIVGGVPAKEIKRR